MSFQALWRVAAPAGLALWLLAGVAGAGDHEAKTRGGHHEKATDAELHEKAGELFGRACQADVDRLCREERGDARRLGSCMRQHLHELAPECREQLRKGTARPAPPAGADPGPGDWRAACDADRQRFCIGVRGGDAGTRRCLLNHATEVSRACRKMLQP